jgi:hypothetical protein
MIYWERRPIYASIWSRRVPINMDRQVRGSLMSDVAYQVIYALIISQRMTAADQTVIHYLWSTIGYASIPPHAHALLTGAVRLTKERLESSTLVDSAFPIHSYDTRNAFSFYHEVTRQECWTIIGRKQEIPGCSEAQLAWSWQLKAGTHLFLPVWIRLSPCTWECWERVRVYGAV